MKTKPPTAAARTNRPELWASTYWAPCRDARLVPAEIIRNRDTFARTWKLKTRANVCLSPLRTYGPGWELDHLELYRDERGALVAIASNYGHPPPPWLGMAEVAPLYVIGAKSYAARFESLRALRAAFRTVDGNGRAAR